ncbi:tetratricopeptide repeat protein [Kitasatospora sp. NPDC088134]|uniref:tetratricopeptide repeat protein n=1 Tax=Kitasatospora sp. NPDC088134 TaxID=3364071 RepID=UPI0037FF52B3
MGNGVDQVLHGTSRVVPARVRSAHDADHHLELLRWAAGLLPPALREQALAELAQTDLAVQAAPHSAPRFPAGAGGGAAAGRAPVADTVAALRATRTVLEGDALLSGTPTDWSALAAAHRQEPFDHEQMRALVGRPDCPDDFSAVLLTPWDDVLGNRVSARRTRLSEPVRRILLASSDRLRRPLLRLLVTVDDAADTVRRARRLDLLVRAVDGFDHHHLHESAAFWDAVGAALRELLGEDRAAWERAALLLPEFPGTLRQLAVVAGRPPTPPAAAPTGRPGRTAPPGPESEAPAGGPAVAHAPDLRVLAHAPAAVLVAVLAEHDDAPLARMAEPCTRRDRGRVREGNELLVPLLERIRLAGVPPRPLFAAWAAGSLFALPGAPRVCAWLYGMNPSLDRSIDRRSSVSATWRQEIAAGRPPRPAADDLVAALRGAAGPVEAQLVLEGTCGTDRTPWPELVEAHGAEPLPEHVVSVLLGRPGFRAELASKLPARRLQELAGQNADIDRAMLGLLPEPTPPGNLVHDNPRFTHGVLHRVRSAGHLDDATVLRSVRPASAALGHGRALWPRDPLCEPWRAACTRLFLDAAAEHGPGLWHLLAARLPTCTGSLPRLLTPEPHDRTLLLLHRRLTGVPVSDPGTAALLDSYEAELRDALAWWQEKPVEGLRLLPDRAAALVWLKAARPLLPRVGWAADTARPALATELPVLLAPYLQASDRCELLVRITETAVATAVRVGDVLGEAKARGTLGIVLMELGRREEAVAAHERAFVLMREAGDVDRQGRISRNLGTALMELGRHEEAAEAYRRAAALFREAGLPLGEEKARANLAEALEQLGRAHPATGAAEAAGSA